MILSSLRMTTCLGTVGSLLVFHEQLLPWIVIRTVQVVLGDPSLSADGRRTRPVRYLERPIQKLILLLPSLHADPVAPE